MTSDAKCPNCGDTFPEQSIEGLCLKCLSRLGFASESPGSEPVSSLKLGDYEVIREISRGGMGVVYEALDRERNQRVALKTLKQIDPTTVYRFKQEFRSLAELVHPNLIPLYELIYDGQWFFVMESVANAVDFQSYLRAAPGSEHAATVDSEDPPPVTEEGTKPPLETRDIFAPGSVVNGRT